MDRQTGGCTGARKHNARRLVELLTETFASRGQGLPKKWHFRVKGKPVHLSSGRTLEELQISNGDIFQIIAGENYEMF